MKKYIALITIVLISTATTFASVVACPATSGRPVASFDTLVHDTLTVHDTVTVFDTVYNDSHDTIYQPGTSADDTIYVHDTLQRVYTYGDIIAAPAAAGSGKVAGNGHFPVGTAVELGAVPAQGYRFVRWQDNNTENPRTVAVEGSNVYTAFFDTIIPDPSGKGFARTRRNSPRPATADTTLRDTTYVHDTTFVHDTILLDRHDTLYIPVVVVRDTFWMDTNQFFDVIILSGNEEKGLVSGNGYFMNGSEVEIAAIPREGYRFVFWHDGDRSNPRTLRVDDIEIFVAEFAADTANTEEPDEPDEPDEKPYEPRVEMVCDGLALAVTCPANAMVRIFTPDGRMQVQSEGTGDKRDNTVRSFQMPQAGVYLVQVASFPVRKIALKEGYSHRL